MSNDPETIQQSSSTRDHDTKRRLVEPFNTHVEDDSLMADYKWDRYHQEALKFPWRLNHQRGHRRQEASDAYSHYVLKKIPADIVASLSDKQLEAFKLALEERHPVDRRISIPLWFIKLYLVVAMGRDNRAATKVKENYRRVFSMLFGVLGGVYVAAALLTPLILFGLYALKTWLNIDIFSQFHLSDIFPL